jgi:hypothetical protein
MTVAAGDESEVSLTRTGQYTGVVSGEIAADDTSPLPVVKTLVQTFRIDDPVGVDDSRRSLAIVSIPPLISDLDKGGGSTKVVRAFPFR